LNSNTAVGLNRWTNIVGIGITPVAIDIEPEEIKISETVSIVWAIEDEV